MSSITDLLGAGGMPDRHAANALGSFALGTVSENANDKFPAMVQVEFTAWQQGENITQWLPVLCSYAGNAHGHYLIPEVGDIVLVGFMGPMMEQPFVLGSFYPAAAILPGEQFSDKNTTRHLKTKGGVACTISDEDGKSSVEIATAKGLRMRIDDDSEAVTLTDKDGKNSVMLDCKAGAIAVAGDKKISLKAGSCEITLDGNAGAITIKCDKLTIDAGQTAELKSGNMLTVKGGMTTVEGAQQLALKGSAMCEISGGIVKIN